jgi:hypothetical protein
MTLILFRYFSDILFHFFDNKWIWQKSVERDFLSNEEAIVINLRRICRNIRIASRVFSQSNIISLNVEHYSALKER